MLSEASRKRDSFVYSRDLFSKTVHQISSNCRETLVSPIFLDSRTSISNFKLHSSCWMVLTVLATGFQYLHRKFVSSRFKSRTSWQEGILYSISLWQLKGENCFYFWIFQFFNTQRIRFPEVAEKLWSTAALVWTQELM